MKMINPLLRVEIISLASLLWAFLIYLMATRKTPDRETTEEKVTIRLAVITITTLIHANWLNTIIRRFDPILLIMSYLTMMALIFWFVYRLLNGKKILVQMLSVATISYLVMVIAFPIVEISVYGKEVFRVSFFAAPMISFGWLHGAIVTVAIFWKRSNTPADSPAGEPLKTGRLL